MTSRQKGRLREDRRGRGRRQPLPPLVFTLAMVAIAFFALPFLGLLWPRFMEFAGPMIGAAFSLEGYAFFIEPRTVMKGEVGEQLSMFIEDPDGHAIEFKAFEDEDDRKDALEEDRQGLGLSRERREG